MNPEIKAKREELAKILKDLEELAEKHGEPVKFFGRRSATGYVPEAFVAKYKAAESKEKWDLEDQIPFGVDWDNGLEAGEVWLPSMC